MPSDAILSIEVPSSVKPSQKRSHDESKESVPSSHVVRHSESEKVKQSRKEVKKVKSRKASKE